MRQYTCTYWALMALAFGAAGVDSFFFKSPANVAASPSSKENLLSALDDPRGFNKATKERTDLVSAMTLDNPTASPGSTSSFGPLAAGTWRVVYAPHIYTGGKLAGGKFSPVVYILNPDGTMISHARYEVPLIGAGWLSVSGTYGSQDDDRICRVDFDQAWVKLINDDEGDCNPYDDLESVPPSIWKDVINSLGKLFFIDSVSVFPVSYLDNDTIIFDFELLGTRICARKVSPADWRV